MILWLIDRARALGLPYVYLGFWVADCAKMEYKARFRPIEAYTAQGWTNLDDQTVFQAPARETCASDA